MARVDAPIGSVSVASFDDGSAIAFLWRVTKKEDEPVGAPLAEIRADSLADALRAAADEVERRKAPLTLVPV